MQTKTIITFVAVMVGVLVGITALMWNFAQQGVEILPEVAGEMRHVKSFGDAQDKVGEITLVEFSDLQCPACAGVQGPLTDLLSKYEGKVRLVFRHLPLTSIHKNAMAAAILAEAAGEQDKFWQMHDLLYLRQTEWSELGDPREKFLEYASELEMDVEKVRADLESEDLKQRVLLDSTDAVRYKVQATPTFFLDGERVEFPQLDGKIQSKLSE